MVTALLLADTDHVCACLCLVPLQVISVITVNTLWASVHQTNRQTTLQSVAAFVNAIAWAVVRPVVVRPTVRVALMELHIIFGSVQSFKPYVRVGAFTLQILWKTFKR